MNSINSEKQMISESALSDRFREVMTDNGIQTIGDLTKLTKELITSIPGFTFQMLVEYREFLTKNDLDIK